MASPQTAPPPIPLAELEAICAKACERAFEGETGYEHSKTEGWNKSVVQSVLASLLEASPKDKFKFIVNSTVIQHGTQNRPRGMHSAQGAFWDAAIDGYWSWKFDGTKGEHPKEFDLVLNITWIGLGQHE